MAPQTPDIRPILKDAIFFVQSDQIQSTPEKLAWGHKTKTLRSNEDTGVVLEVVMPAKTGPAKTVSYDQALEVILLKGEMTIADITLRKGDYLRIPADAPMPSPVSKTGAEFLMFLEKTIPETTEYDDSTTYEPSNWLLVRGNESPWVAGNAMAEAGRDDVPLKIKHYKQDPDTGARTYLVAVKPGVVIPWEVHDVAEEAYIIEGDYTLSECLPSGVNTGDYEQGGYFYRPAGIAHNGPKSGTKSGVVMLIRTPAPLIVKLVDGCG